MNVDKIYFLLNKYNHFTDERNNSKLDFVDNLEL